MRASAATHSSASRGEAGVVCCFYSGCNTSCSDTPRESAALRELWRAGPHPRLDALHSESLCLHSECERTILDIRIGDDRDARATPHRHPGRKRGGESGNAGRINRFVRSSRQRGRRGERGTLRKPTPSHHDLRYQEARVELFILRDARSNRRRAVRYPFLLYALHHGRDPLHHRGELARGDSRRMRGHVPG